MAPYHMRIRGSPLVRAFIQVRLHGPKLTDHIVVYGSSCYRAMMALMMVVSLPAIRQLCLVVRRTMAATRSGANQSCQQGFVCNCRTRRRHTQSH